MIRVLEGDCRTVLPTLPAESVQCVVTSPPYFGLRDYNVAGQIGLEATPDEYIQTMVAVFREVRRVLRDDGTCWVNLGSSYSAGKGSNVTDQLNRLLEGGSVFFTHPGACRIAAHGVDVALQDKRSPNGIFANLFAVQRVDGEQGRQDFGKVIDLFAGPGRRRFGLPGIGGVIAEPADAKMGVDELQHGTIVATQLDAQSEAIFAVARIGSGSGEDDETTLAIDQPGKPRISGGIRWHSVWDTFTQDAVLKGAEDIDLVDQAIALGDRPETLAGLLCDFRVAKASEKQVTLASIHSSLSLAVSDVRQLWFVLRCGSIVPYSRLYADASRFANALLPKQDLGMPWRLARALQEDGWILRSPIIWSKPNPMPESVIDRPTSAHEHIFLLTKSERYYYDADAVREEGTIPAGTLGAKGSEERFAMAGVNSRPPEYKVYSGTRNLRNVWTIATAPFPEAHFATFPSALAERCIKAGTSERGCCAQCGKPWVRERTDSVGGKGSWHDHRDDAAAGMRQCKHGQASWDSYVAPSTTGWAPACQCNAPTQPCTVLDPFGGAGTTGLVADRLQRDAIMIELSPAYCAMLRNRITNDMPLFAPVA